MTVEYISVPRDLLAAACHCVRKHAGTDSETYKALSAFSLSKDVCAPPAAALRSLVGEE